MPFDVTATRLRVIAALFAIVAACAVTVATANAQPNPIVTENLLTGNPASEWDVSGVGDASIQGFATDISVNRGQSVTFKIKTDAAAYHIAIYRLGWYQGNGARHVGDGVVTATLPQTQPDDLFDSATGLTDCGNWDESAHWDVPSDAVSGVYVARLERDDTNGASHIVFVVRNDASTSDLFFQTSDATWQAYNGYGGGSLYVGGTSYPGGHAVKVSYNRPFFTRGGGGGSGASEDWVFNSEYPMIRWLEKNGYDVAYTTDVDSDRDGARMLQHHAFLSVGHDEYWSAGQRTNVQAARNAGVHLGFFSGNEIYWKTRWEPSTDASTTPYRTLVCYKEGTLGENACGSKCDPTTGVWTGLWRDGCTPTYDANDACLPENALSGQISWVGTTGSIQVPDTYKSLRFWRNTSVASLGSGQTATLPAGTLGYEWDWRQYPASDPPGRVALSSTTVSGKQHQLSLYRHSSGALVFGAGTVQWPWGLDGTHDGGSSTPSLDVKQSTANLLADMGAQPGSPESGLVAATLSTDTQAPSSTIASPLNGATLPSGTPVTLSGSASDPGGGVVAGVQVSTDGGATWQAATGTTSWSFGWTPTAQGSVTIESRGVDDSGNLEVPGGGETPTDVITITVGPPAAPNCPCTVFSPADVPQNPGAADGPSLELGMKFNTSYPGYVTGVRFYKGFSNTGTHVGHLWTSTGTLLSEVTFTGESASGWQEATFPSAIAIDPNTTYVISVHTPLYYPYTQAYFNVAHQNGVLRGLANGEDGTNGVYKYTSLAEFPTDSYNATNYWVDLVFNTTTGPDVTAPSVTSVSPVSGATGVAIGSSVSAVFDEALDASTVTGSTFTLEGLESVPVTASVSWNAATRIATLTPSALLASSTTYTATLKGGESNSQLKDVAGNALAADYTWVFTTAAPPPPPPNEGPGGPILVISAAADPFSRYPVEILRAEGLNEFTAMDLSLVTPSVLNDYDVVVLGSVPLSASDVTMLSDWTTAGGTLVALRPDKQLASLMGLSDDASTLSNAYLLVQTVSGPGAGICAETMQFHGGADLYSLAGATEVATLYSTASVSTPHPAVTMRSVGASGGQAIAFTYDLARSVVYTRQGNPAWAGQKRDGQIPPTRSDDLFFGPASGDVQPNWVDFAKIAIPQADEQQRLLANLILQGSAHRRPLPRLWYLPRGLSAAVVMTGDDHASNGTTGRFNQLVSLSPSNTTQAVADWTALRMTSYVYPNTPISDAQAAAFAAQGFEIALHLTSNCENWTPASLDAAATSQLSQFSSAWPSLAAPATNRTHCIAWSDWASEPKVESQHGIRLDANYYYWPASWILDRPGLFTGSGIPMRFADLDGSLIDCYQVATQMPDESGETFPAHIDSLLERAQGPRGYYGVFCANMHTDNASSSGSDAIVASALARQVPVVSAKQMLTWLDGRSGSSFGSLAYSGGVLSFTMTVGAGAHQLQAMLPSSTAEGLLVSLTKDGGPVSFTNRLVKGQTYAFFDAAPGSWSAVYMHDTTPPVISSVVATPHADGTATVTWTTDEASDSHVDYGTSPGSLATTAGSATLVTSHSVTLTTLAYSTQYHFRVRSKDADTNEATEPPTSSAPLSFTTPTSPCPAASSVAEFSLGTASSVTVANESGGELILTPAYVTEFDGASLPASWQAAPWGGGGTTVVSGGALTIDGARAATTASFTQGRSLEFVATFTADAYQHVGWVANMVYDAPWALFSTGPPGDGVYARTDNGLNQLISASLLGSPHRYRIDWTATGFDFFVDGAQVASASHPISVGLLASGSDGTPNANKLNIDWLRVTPYAASGSWTSQVFDHVVPTLWGTASWSATTPAGTSVALLARQGNTATPDAAWTPFIPLTNGGTIGGGSRYLQLRADLATSSASRTPALASVSVDCTEGSDVAPPAISNIVATPASSGTSATVTWTTDEPASSHVDFGTSAGGLTSNADDATLVTSHSLPLTGLVAGTQYHYRVTSVDLSSNAATSPASPAAPLTFTTPAPACFVDDASAEFAAGDVSANTFVSALDDGEVMLRPGRVVDFDSTPPTSEWDSHIWDPGGYFTISGGKLVVNSARYNTEPASGYGPGSSMEFVATFGPEKNQHAGFGGGNDVFPGEIFNAPPAAIFSTGAGNNVLYARTWTGSFSDFALPSGLIGSPHRYRVDWNATTIDYWVDGVLLHTQVATIGGTMRPAFSDHEVGGPELEVDWVHVSPYASPGTFVSRVYDAGSPASWDLMTWTADVPGGTTLAMSVRRGSTPVPDVTWSAFAAVASSGTVVGGVSRYIQYRAELATTNAAVTPVLRDVTIACTPCTASALAAITNLAVSRSPSPGSDGRRKVSVTFTPVSGAASVQVFRAPFGGYPRYDNAGGATVPTPSYPPPAPWTLTSVTASGQDDDPPARDAWSYVAFSVNACGVASTVSNRPAEILNYVLGDVSDGLVICSGDNLVTLPDLSLLGGHYGSAVTGSDDWACADVGPTATGGVRGRPLTDGVINFEDLVVYAINWNISPTASPNLARAHRMPADRDEVVLEAPAHVEAGEHFSVTLHMRGTGRVHGVSALLRWNAATVAPGAVAAGVLTEELSGVAWSHAPGQVDVVVLGGAEQGIAGDGAIATVSFRALASGAPGIALASLIARDGDNAAVALAERAAGPAIPTATAFDAVAPNPAPGRTTLAFSLAEEGPVDLTIYSVDGRRVTSLVHETRSAGAYRVAWEGTRADGTRVAPGLYFVRLTTPHARFTRSLILVR